MKDKARILITEECHRSCFGCCNTYSHIMENSQYINDFTGLPSNLDEIMITGGEPMLSPIRTERIAKELRNAYPASKIYLYSALYNKNLGKIIPILDGLHYTLHERANEEDIHSLYRLQELLQVNKEDWKEKSFRLYIDDKVNLPIDIIHNIWSQVNISKWLTEQELLDKQPDGLPEGERLFIYTGK